MGKAAGQPKQKQQAMITTKSDREELLSTVGGIFAELIELYDSVSHERINSIPYESSWTASQLLDHVAKSTNGIASALMQDGKTPGREVTKRVPGLKTIFLDFSNKMQSPVSIVPGDGPFEKQDVIDKLNMAFEELAKEARHTNLDGLVEGLPLGPVTKLELLHFVVYHSTRHLEQMKRICNAFND